MNPFLPIETVFFFPNEKSRRWERVGEPRIVWNSKRKKFVGAKAPYKKRKPEVSPSSKDYSRDLRRDFPKEPGGVY